ncbi:MAG: sigma 54-interacting transcriptional regulator [Deltaproteobacteria bacterium]|nr:sigma 54-interacting transcriptional regulator [Deltaproteobacteria bacterium]
MRVSDPSASNPIDEDAVLRAIVEGVEAKTGDEFFASLVRHLAWALRVQYSFVSEFTEDGRHFRTKALWARGRLAENLTVPIAGTPCEAVLCGGMSHHPDRLQELFPEDVALVTWGARSYCGVPLLDRAGVVVGHLAIIDDAPMLDGPRGLAILRIFAARARAELERQRAEAALRESEDRLARILDSAMDAIVTIDERRCVELFNDAAEKAFRCPAPAAIGRPIDRFLTDGFRRALDDSMRALARGEATAPYVWAPHGLKARDAEGREFTIEATVSAVTVQGRGLYTLILRDVEQRRQAEESLRVLHRQNEYLQEEIRAVHNVDEIVGQSAALEQVLEQARLVAPTDSSVLILGETGTGKELVARAVHSASRRRDFPLVKINCAALPSGLIESELFGHEKGSFTGAHERRIGRFELADRGTIFLDELGEIPLEVQVKLLRVLQEQEIERVGGSTPIKVDVRVIAATNRDLTRAVADGTFRSDLFYRLNVFPVHMPPLRARTEDIPALVHYFAARYAATIGRRIERITRDTMERLVAYEWPGNVRELENVIERAVILSPGPELAVPSELLPAPSPAVRGDAPGRPAVAAPEETIPLDALERDHIIAVLKQANWRIDGPQGAARILDMHPSTLRSRMKKLGIRRSLADLS